MASKWCLLKKYVDQFKAGLKSGEINPEKLSQMTSKERRDFFAKYVGEVNAKNINALFESKLLLKNQKAGYISWAKKVVGITPQTRNDLIAKIERLDTVLSPESETVFLEDLATSRLGINISEAEAKQIYELSQKIVSARKEGNIDAVQKMSPSEFVEYIKDKENNEKRKVYGRAVIELINYTKQLRQDVKKTVLQKFVGLLDSSKASKASFDDSAILNQGFPILANVLTARTWARNALRTFQDMARVVGGRNVYDEVQADLVSRPNYLNGLYKDMQLAVMVTEEDFPTALPERIPVIGKAYKATEVAFNSFQLRNRMDVFDLFMAMAEKQGKDLSSSSPDIQGLGKLVNSLTARGSLGRFEPVGNLVNSPFFSLRKQVAAIDSLIFYQSGNKSAFARKLGAYATLQQILLIAVVLGIAASLDPESVETDPTSADYGKIRVKDSRFDITQGRGSYLILAMRLVTGKYKSSTTGEITELNDTKFGSKTKLDLLGDFVQNKLSPVLQEAIAILNGQIRGGEKGEKPTIASVLQGLYLPLGIQNRIEDSNTPYSANTIALFLADFFGISTNTYPSSNVKTKVIPTDVKLKEGDFLSMVEVYSKAMGADPETAFNRIFSGQKIVQVSAGQIVVVDRQDVGESEAVKKEFVKKYGGNTKEVKLDHTIPIKLGGAEERSNWRVVSNAVWSSYTKTENFLIKAVKEKRISLKEAQSEIVKFKKITDTKKRESYALEIQKKYR